MASTNSTVPRFPVGTTVRFQSTFLKRKYEAKVLEAKYRMNAWLYVLDTRPGTSSLYWEYELEAANEK